MFSPLKIVSRPIEYWISLDLTGSSYGLVHKPLSSDDPRQRCPDITLAKEKLGWRPSVTFEQGISKTIGWYLANRKWLANVVSGNYQKYYESMYRNS